MSIEAEELKKSNSQLTFLFFRSYGFGGPILSALYGGGQLSMFVGWIMVIVLDQCVAFSLAELASRFPTSAGPHYWSFQLTKSNQNKLLLSFITGWVWLIGNWTITLSGE